MREVVKVFGLIAITLIIYELTIRTYIFKELPQQIIEKEVVVEIDRPSVVYRTSPTVPIVIGITDTLINPNDYVYDYSKEVYSKDSIPVKVEVSGWGDLNNIKVGTSYLEKTKYIRDNTMYLYGSYSKPISGGLREFYGVGIDYTLKDKIIVGSSFKSDLRGNNYISLKVGLKVD